MYHRAIRGLARSSSNAMRFTQNSGMTRSVRKALGIPASAVASWPPQPAVAASTTGTSGSSAARAAGSASGLLEMIGGEEDDETRFRIGGKRDRGPDSARREGAQSFRAGDSGSRGGARGGSGRDGSGRRDNSDTRPSAPDTTGEPDKELTAADYANLTPEALRALNPGIADILQRRTDNAWEVPNPYTTEDVSPLAILRAETGPRPFDTGLVAPSLSMFDDSAGTVTRTLRTLYPDEAKVVLQVTKEDETYAGPSMHALIARDGTVAPLDEEDASRLARLQSLPTRSIPPAIMADPVARAALVLQATLVRRAVRASYSEEEIARMAAAILIQRGESDDTANARLRPFEARRQDVYRKGTDPLLDSGPLPFDTRRVTFVSNMTWNSSPNGAGVDRRASIVAKADGMGLPPDAVSWLTAIAGPRYVPKTGQLKLTCEAHPTGSANKRAVLETLVALVKEARSLAGKHGGLTSKARMPAYAHS